MDPFELKHTDIVIYSPLRDTSLSLNILKHGFKKAKQIARLFHSQQPNRRRQLQFAMPRSWFAAPGKPLLPAADPALFRAPPTGP